MTTPELSETSLTVTSLLLGQLPWLVHGSTTRRFNSPSSDRIDDLRRMQGLLAGSPKFLVHADQRHTSNVAVVTPETLQTTDATRRLCIKATDGLVTSEPGVAIAVLTADCAPVLISDPVKRIIAVAHAGWRGTHARIVEATVEAMKTLGGRPSDFVAWIGPMAGGCCYEVSSELIDSFAGEFGDLEAQGFAAGRHLDIVALNAFQLKLAGLHAQNIDRSNYCTIHQREHFYSYRADAGTHGRIISMIAIRPDGAD